MAIVDVLFCLGCDMRSMKNATTYDDDTNLRQRALGARDACATFEFISGEAGGRGGVEKHRV
jgi:hypothetical protein